MDFSNRSAQPQPAQAPAAAGPSGTSRRNNKADNSKWGRIGIVAAILLIVILLVAVIVRVGTASSDSNEAGYVDNNKLQAVFLNTGQVYFGKIQTLNSKYFVLSNIYYLQTSGGGQAATGASANTSVSLVKLGCELHEPFDKMVINRSQVTFWENLQDGGQVAKAVTTFQKQNPSGQKCADQSNSSNNTSNSVQNAGTNNGSSAGSNSSSTTPSTTPSTTTNRP